jgi:hypothetical protein
LKSGGHRLGLVDTTKRSNRNLCGQHR